MSLRFGTDGVRGVANRELSPELVLSLGRAAARVFDAERFLVGRDTRVSGPLLQSALMAGLASEGTDVVDLGVLPTPGVASLAAADQVPAAMISASHNPYPDNGIKFFAAGGRKLADEVETRLEAELDRLLLLSEAGERPDGAGVGSIELGAADALRRYGTNVVQCLDGRRLDGLHIVLDCANGAASTIAPAVLRDLGATVDVLFDQPDGRNINAACGSTHPDHLQQQVRARGADAGLAFDGDADRVLAVDESGHLVDGDHIIAICARDMRDRHRLKDDTVVVTVMTNLGFRLAMAEAAINVRETRVGDRYVLEALEEGGWSLGGEQSGHVIFPDLATTGDGLLTGLQLLDVVRRSGSPLGELARTAMTRLPQVLRNVRVAAAGDLAAATELWQEVTAAERELGEEGRVLVRASGTEPLVRVMVEATSQARAEQVTARLCEVVERVMGAAGTPGAA